MSHERFSHAMDTAGLSLPREGKIALIGAPSDFAPDGLDMDRCEIVQTFFPAYAAWQKRGAKVLTSPKGPYAATIVFVPRSRDLAKSLIAQASALTPGGLVIVDGAKTDGIDSLGKALKARVPLEGQVSKSHGKILWFTGGADFADWVIGQTMLPSGDVTAPGVFSADGADPASVYLANVLPQTLKGRFADLGAGWGWLSREVLKRTGVVSLDLVEAEKTALDCARLNVTDDRAKFCWGDATVWTPDAPLDGVIMNPPFHQGRKAEPQIGCAFIASAARILAPHGQLWLVANRHLPYERTLAESFRETKEVSGDSKFKVLFAARPNRPSVRRRTP